MVCTFETAVAHVQMSTHAQTTISHVGVCKLLWDFSYNPVAYEINKSEFRGVCVQEQGNQNGHVKTSLVPLWGETSRYINSINQSIQHCANALWNKADGMTLLHLKAVMQTCPLSPGQQYCKWPQHSPSHCLGFVCCLVCWESLITSIGSQWEPFCLKSKNFWAEFLGAWGYVSGQDLKKRFLF